MQGFITKGKIYIFDCNPRVGGSMAFSYYKGIDFFKFSIFEQFKLNNKNFKKEKNKNNVFYKINKVYSLSDNSF